MHLAALWEDTGGSYVAPLGQWRITGLARDKPPYAFFFASCEHRMQANRLENLLLRIV